MMRLRSPRALHLYQLWWQCQEMIVSCGNYIPPGALVAMGEVCVKRLYGEDEVVLEVYVEGGGNFVLVREIDDRLAELCAWWRCTLRCDVRGAHAGVLDKIAKHLRVYQRGMLVAV